MAVIRIDERGSGDRAARGVAQILGAFSRLEQQRQQLDFNKKALRVVHGEEDPIKRRDALVELAAGYTPSFDKGVEGVLQRLGGAIAPSPADAFNAQLMAQEMLSTHPAYIAKKEGQDIRNKAVQAGVVLAEKREERAAAGQVASIRQADERLAQTQQNLDRIKESEAKRIEIAEANKDISKERLDVLKKESEARVRRLQEDLILKQKTATEAKYQFDARNYLARRQLELAEESAKRAESSAAARASLVRLKELRETYDSLSLSKDVDPNVLEFVTQGIERELQQIGVAPLSAEQAQQLLQEESAPSRASLMMHPGAVMGAAETRKTPKGSEIRMGPDGKKYRVYHDTKKVEIIGE